MRFANGSILLSSTFTAFLLAGTTVPAWQKAYDEWTAKDAQEIMTNSPWAKRIPMPAGGRPGIAVLEPGSNGEPPPSAAMGNPSNTTSGTNMTVAANPGSAGPANPNGLHNMPNAQSPSVVSPTAPAPEPVSISVIWASATPIRLAVLKLQSGVNTPTSGEIERVSKPRDNYVIAITGLAAPDGDTDFKQLAANASLSVKGKPGANASTCNYHRIGNTDVYFFRFPRTSLPIADDDHHVDFKVTFGHASIKERFELNNMQYQGRLAL